MAFYWRTGRSAAHIYIYEIKLAVSNACSAAPSMAQPQLCLFLLLSFSASSRALNGLRLLLSNEMFFPPPIFTSTKRSLQRAVLIALLVSWYNQNSIYSSRRGNLHGGSPGSSHISAESGSLQEPFIHLMASSPLELDHVDNDVKLEQQPACPHKPRFTTLPPFLRWSNAPMSMSACTCSIQTTKGPRRREPSASAVSTVTPSSRPPDAARRSTRER